MKHFLLFAVISFTFSSCVKNNPLPVYLSISKWNLVENNDPQAESAGDLTNNLTDAWVYVDNKLVGVFELPCSIPVLTEGSRLVRIYPTVRNNGISATKKIYPFCEFFEQTIDLVPGQTVDIQPVTRYKTACEFWLEDFSEPDLKINTESSSVFIVPENDPAIAITGKYGHVTLTDANGLFTATTDQIPLPQSGAEVYLELDYRNDIGLLTSLIAIGSGIVPNPNISLNPQPTATMVWKKIYIDLRELVSNSTNAEEFSQGFYAQLPGGVAQRDIYLDNIRIVHF